MLQLIVGCLDGRGRPVTCGRAPSQPRTEYCKSVQRRLQALSVMLNQILLSATKFKLSTLCINGRSADLLTTLREEVQLSRVLDLHFESRFNGWDHSQRGSADYDFFQLVPFIPRVHEADLHSEQGRSEVSAVSFSCQFASQSHARASSPARAMHTWGSVIKPDRTSGFHRTY